MKFKLLLSFLACLLTGSLLAQPDCVLQLKYTGTIKGSPFKVQKIVLPNTPYLQGYVAINEREATFTHKINDSSFSVETITEMSSFYCGDIEAIIEGVFKKFRNQYFIRLCGASEKEQVEIQV